MLCTFSGEWFFIIFFAQRRKVKIVGALVLHLASLMDEDVYYLQLKLYHITYSELLPIELLPVITFFFLLFKLQHWVNYKPQMLILIGKVVIHVLSSSPLCSVVSPGMGILTTAVLSFGRFC